MSGSQPTHEMGAFFAPCFMDRIDGERVLRVPLTEYIDSLAIEGVSYMIVNPTRTPAVWDQSNESLLVSGDDLQSLGALVLVKVPTGGEIPATARLNQIDAFPDAWRIPRAADPTQMATIESRLKQQGNGAELSDIYATGLTDAEAFQEACRRIAVGANKNFAGFPPGWFA